MEIEVTRFINNYDMWDYAHSAFEGGSSAGDDTWQAAMETSEKVKFVTKKNADEFRDWFGEFGAWDREEIREMSLRELNALFLQFVAGDYRELEDARKAGREDRYEEMEGGRLYQSGKRWFYYVGV